MPKFLNTAKKAQKDVGMPEWLGNVFDSIGPELTTSIPTVATTALGTFTKPAVRESVKRLRAALGPSREQDVTQMVKDTAERILSTESPTLPIQDKRQAMKVLTSDPLASLYIQDDIVPARVPARGAYVTSSFNNPALGDAQREEIIQILLRDQGWLGINNVKKYLAQARAAANQGNSLPAMVFNPTFNKGSAKDMAELLAHEGTHASQHARGVLDDVRLFPTDRSAKYAGKPVEWEAHYAGDNFVDPVTLDPLTLMQKGYDEMLRRGHAPEDPDVLRRILGSLNTQLAPRPGTRFLDLSPQGTIRPTTWQTMQDQQLSTLLRAVLGK